MNEKTGTLTIFGIVEVFLGFWIVSAMYFLEPDTLRTSILVVSGIPFLILILVLIVEGISMREKRGTLVDKKSGNKI